MKAFKLKHLKIHVIGYMMISWYNFSFTGKNDDRSIYVIMNSICTASKGTYKVRMKAIKLYDANI